MGERGKMANQDLIRFIVEARKRRFDDNQIKAPLLEDGWEISEINEAINSIDKNPKNKFEIYLKDDLIKILEKRAKKNKFTIPEQIGDILRRSCINVSTKTTSKAEKLDDLLVSIFSRQKRDKKE